MDKPKTEFINGLRKFKKRVNSKMKIDKILIFGSRARGKYKKIAILTLFLFLISSRESNWKKENLGCILIGILMNLSRDLTSYALLQKNYEIIKLHL